jgi:hypothetical protein
LIEYSDELLIKGGIELFNSGSRKKLLLILFILISSFLSSKQIKITYRVEEGKLNLTEELMLSTPFLYENYEMYVVFKKGELTYSNSGHASDINLNAVELFPIAVIRVKRDNPHDGHDAYSIKMIDETTGIEKFGEIMTIAEKICYGESDLLQKSLNFEISEIIMILKVLHIL